MNKKIILFIIIVLVLVITAFFLIGQVRDFDREDPGLPVQPDIEGQIYSIEEDRFLVAEGFEGQEYDGDVEKFVGNAFWFWVDQETKLIDKDEKELEFSSLEVGDKVKVWSTGIVLESYPAQATAAKIIFLEKKELVQDKECFVGGCSGELCTTDPLAISTCEELPGTECLRKEGVVCGLVGGECQWILSETAAECFFQVEQEYGKGVTETRIKHLFEKAKEL